MKTVKWLPLKLFPFTVTLADNVKYMFSSSGVKTIMITMIMIIIKTIIIVKMKKNTGVCYLSLFGVSLISRASDYS